MLKHKLYNKPFSASEKKNLYHLPIEKTAYMEKICLKFGVSFLGVFCSFSSNEFIHTDGISFLCYL